MPFNFQNLVGYNKVFVKGNKMNLLCINWNSVGKEIGTLNEVMDRQPLITIGDEENGDYIDTWDMENGDWGKRYYYCRRPDWNDPEAPEYDYTDTWIDADYIPCNIEMESGSSFWLFHKGDNIEGLGFAGQVATGVHGYTLRGGKMNLCGNPYPTLLDLRKSAGQVVIANATTIGDEENGDYVDTWDLTNADWGKRYYYCNRPDWNDPEVPEYDYTDTWIDADYIPGSTESQAGAGCWHVLKANGVSVAKAGPPVYQH